MGFLVTPGHSVLDLGYLCIRDCPLSPLESSFLFGYSYPLTLPLKDQGTLKLGKSPHDIEEQFCHVVLFAAEGQLLLAEMNLYPLLGQLLHNLPEVIKVTRQSV